jgi:hypothetical protein
MLEEEMAPHKVEAKLVEPILEMLDMENHNQDSHHFILAVPVVQELQL